MAKEPHKNIRKRSMQLQTLMDRLLRALRIISWMMSSNRQV